jgi:type IX secretion system PorP/SprF family membrane protein
MRRNLVVIYNPTQFNSIKLIWALLFIFLSISRADAQYFQFSQYNFTNQRVNPAMIGISKYMSASLDSRSQKTGGDFSVNSNIVSFTRPLLNRSTGRAWSGIGITLMDDRSGGIFKTQEATISYAANIRLSRYRILSMGFKGLYQTRRISFAGYNTGSQFVPDRGFDNSLPNGESSGELTNSFSTFSTGLYWQETDRQENVTGYWGISIFDLNKPNDSFAGNKSQLSSSLVFTGGFRAYQNRELSIFPEILYTGNSSNHLVNMGARWQYEIKPMPNQKGDRVDVLTKYAFGRSAILGVQLHRENLSVGMSYDFPVFNNNPSNLGALEVGIEIRKLVLTRAGKDRIRRKKENEKKKAATKKLPNQKPIVRKTNTDSLENLIAKDKAESQIEIVKPDTVQSNPIAVAGKLKHEPLIVEKITLHFQFEFNSVDLDDETEKFLDQLSETLKEDKELKIKIAGHTDNVGSEKFNQKLSLKRAESVRDFLLKNGIIKERINADGKGMSVPLVENETEEGRRKNRRVEIVLYYER